MAGTTVSRTSHFALHRSELDAPSSPQGPQRLVPAAAGSGSEPAQTLFTVREPWVGALVPKRWAKRAVTRNAIKRQIYNVSQSFESELPAAAHVVRLRAAFDRARFVSATSELLKQAVRAELRELFTRAAP
jgi:ribonuclease P protein component